MDPNHSPSPNQKARRPYQKPQVETVSLRPKETVLGACMSSSLISNSEQGGSCALPGPCTFERE